jgi:hypothetical protein
MLGRGVSSSAGSNDSCSPPGPAAEKRPVCGAACGCLRGVEEGGGGTAWHTVIIPAAIYSGIAGGTAPEAGASHASHQLGGTLKIASSVFRSQS